MRFDQKSEISNAVRELLGLTFHKDIAIQIHVLFKIKL